ncbi:MAG: ATP-dependent DNA helicase RecG, partial [Verrucomicrobiota bacterium]|nr:ATP-dependent DNA helicase RecG [Verrucomicrobiota bacterium]
NDLLRHRPRRYEDRRHFLTIAQLKLNESSTTRGKIVACGLKRWANGTKSVFEMILEDGTARLHCRWWNLPFLQNYFKIGDEVLVFGKPNSLKPRTIDHPETEIIEVGEDISIHLNRIAPIYPLTEGLPQRWLRSLVWRTLEEFVRAVDREERLKISAQDVETISRNAAFRAIHFPDELADVEIARQRLALDELIELQWAIQIRRKKLEANARGLPCAGNNRLIRKFLSRLDFPLTEAQNKVLREIRRDLGGPHPMRRLLQGDVGSGKTIVAACSALMALESGFNVALMAPTEILAEQHYQNFKSWFASLEIAVELLTGSVKTVELNTQNSELKTFFIGTHALIEKSFVPENLGLVIIDEQHKFGVTQREKLLKKGNYPHLLVMTATPIPRTLGLTLYGDLDISVIDQLPAGRGKIKTFIRAEEKLPKVWEFVREKMQEGRQAYIVYPRIEDSGLGELKTLVHEFDKLQKQFAPHRLGLLHGRLGSEEKDQVMKGFRANEIKALVATSVIEVGMDIPNATVMVIENAEQFGLAQLHQLRGRIGRGALDSYCILIAAAKTEEAKERLNILEKTNDGFKIAEADLKLRGPGELVGQQQSGLPALRFANLTEDENLVEQARRLVREKLSKNK